MIPSLQLALTTEATFEPTDLRLIEFASCVTTSTIRFDAGKRVNLNQFENDRITHTTIHGCNKRRLQVTSVEKIAMIPSLQLALTTEATFEPINLLLIDFASCVTTSTIRFDAGKRRAKLNQFEKDRSHIQQYMDAQKMPTSHQITGNISNIPKLPATIELTEHRNNTGTCEHIVPSSDLIVPTFPLLKHMHIRCCISSYTEPRPL